MTLEQKTIQLNDELTCTINKVNALEHLALTKIFSNIYYSSKDVSGSVDLGKLLSKIIEQDNNNVLILRILKNAVINDTAITKESINMLFKNNSSLIYEVLYEVLEYNFTDFFLMIMKIAGKVGDLIVRIVPEDQQEQKA